MTDELNDDATPVGASTWEATEVAVAVEQPFVLPDEAWLQALQAAAFRSLCQHLQQHSAQVSNMDLMTLAGFCRNCLAKVRIQC
jgi:Protein of unknown function (DUF1244)